MTAQALRHSIAEESRLQRSLTRDTVPGVLCVIAESRRSESAIERFIHRLALQKLLQLCGGFETSDESLIDDLEAVRGDR